MTVFKNCKSYLSNKAAVGNFTVIDGNIVSISNFEINKEDTVIENCIILPGFCDVHVHFREPGFSYKEDMLTGSMAAAKGGYTDVCTMPNLNPVPDSYAHLLPELEAIEQKAKIGVHPYGSISVNEKGEELAALQEMSDYVIAFSDDGRGIQTKELMLDAMEKAKKLGKIIVAHCEDNSLLHGGYIHDGKYAREHSHKGICSESEWGPIKRDIELSKMTNCPYHVCHISCKESVELIRNAKACGVDITCETAPHYLLLDDSDLKEDGRFKMNPPLRDASDREALLEGIIDGTIDMIATDHAPHSKEEKSRGLEGSNMGVIGLETAFPKLYSELVMKNVISMEKLISLLSASPRKRFNIKDSGFSVWETNCEYTINEEDILSMGKSTPFLGDKVYTRCLMTVYNNKTVYDITK